MSASAAGVASVRLARLGITVTPRTVDQVVEFISAKPAGRARVIVGHNLHSTYMFHTDEKFSRLYKDADLVLVDGQPVRWAARAQGANIPASARVGSVDWIKALKDVRDVHRIAVVGASEAANGATSSYLRKLSGADVRGWHGVHWSSDRATEVVSQLRAFEPDLVLIGLGMPLQEHMFSERREELPIATYALVGGAIDQIAGTQRRAPSWIGAIGFEWLWRLMLDPRRLGHRYLVEPVRLARILRAARRRAVQEPSTDRTGPA